MNPSQTGGHPVQNIEVASLSTLFSEVENSVSGQIQRVKTQSEYYTEASQDAA